MKKAILVLAVAISMLPVFSQDADVMTEILAKKQASIMDFSYLIASQLGMEVSPFEAYTYCDRFGTFSFNQVADAPVTVSTVSLFFMTNYDIPGGIMWSAFHSRRYAWKELKSKGFWKKGMDPDSSLSGREVVMAASKFFTMFPDAILRNPTSVEASDHLRAALLANGEDKK